MPKSIVDGGSGQFSTENKQKAIDAGTDEQVKKDVADK